MKVFLTILLLYLSNIYAQESLLYIEKTDGTTETIEITDIASITFSDVTDVRELEKLNKLVKNFVLQQNYPNPFNPSTTIEYSLTTAGKVDIKIYSVNGELIKTIENEYKQPGNYKARWNGKNDAGLYVSSGIYIYQVQHNETMHSKKMILIK